MLFFTVETSRNVCLTFLEEFFKRYNVCSDMLDAVYKTFIWLNLFVFQDVTVGKAMI